MAAFELRRGETTVPAETVQAETAECVDSRRLKEECIIALKVYDSCRNQDCLTHDDIGPARAAESVCVRERQLNEGDVIHPPDNAAAVTIDRLRVKKIYIGEKEPNPFKHGYWDIDLKYVFEYRLVFREADGCVIGSVKANSIYNRRLTLFGSVGEDLVVATDLFSDNNDCATMDAEPFIMTEAKAVALMAKIHNRRHRADEADRHSDDKEVHVTIGLFTIIKLFRIVSLTVQSHGFCIPPECEEISPPSPCEFFERLDFPIDIFTPPQKPEFLAGVSANIPFKEVRDESLER